MKLVQLRNEKLLQQLANAISEKGINVEHEEEWLKSATDAASTARLLFEQNKYNKTDYTIVMYGRGVA